MPHPLPDTACRHHTPGGFANSSIAGTLQHIMQVPQVRPGTRGGRSVGSNSAVFMGPLACGLTFNGRTILSMSMRWQQAKRGAFIARELTRLRGDDTGRVIPSEPRANRTNGQQPRRASVMKNSVRLATFTAVCGFTLAVTSALAIAPALAQEKGQLL